MIDYNSLIDWLRRRTGDTGPVRCWSNDYLKHAVEEAVIAVVNDVPEGFSQILDRGTTPYNTIELPSNGVVFTRAYGEVGGDGNVIRSLKWTSESEITDSDPCWRESTEEPTHAIYTSDQTRVWLNGPTPNFVRCAIAMLPLPLIHPDGYLEVDLSYRNLIQYHALTAMYGLTSNGAGKMEMHHKLYLQALDRRRNTNAFNVKNLAESER